MQRRFWGLQFQLSTTGRRKTLKKVFIKVTKIRVPNFRDIFFFFAGLEFREVF